MIDHPNIKDVRRSVEIDNNAIWTTIVEVLTDLELDAMNPRYNEPAMNSLIKAMLLWSESNNSTWDKLRIVGS